MAADERLRTLGLVGLGLVHELNSPLTSTALSLELLLDRIDAGGDAAEVRTAVAENLERVQRMAALVHRFRGLAQGAAPTPAPLQLGDLVTSAMRIARGALAEVAAVHVEHTPGAADDVSVYADPLLLEHALLCLVLNAADVGGHVRVRTAAGPRVDVDDDGPGFTDPEEATALGYSSKGAGGMGVGLALVELIARDAGARLVIGHSDLGGARVSLDFTREAPGD